MEESLIRIRNARQNNLAGVDVDLPRNRLVAITGVSGSGKSSLAFDTLFREGQRRFLETLSAYARQFLGRMEKPDVESIEGLSPAIAVDQKSVARGARSTVGTLTEIVDHLRVLYSRAGRPHCPECGLAVRSQTPEEIAQAILRSFGGEKIQLLAPLIRDRKGAQRALFEDLRKRGFVRVRVDGVVQRVEDVPELERYKRHSIELVIDRFRPDPEKPGRLREALEQALEHGGGDVLVAPLPESPAEPSGSSESGESAEASADDPSPGSPQADVSYSISRSCPGCGADTPPLEPRLFSFNSPHGACHECDGLGLRRQPSTALIVQDPELSIRAGALAVTRKGGGALLFPHVDFTFLEQVGEGFGFDLDTPWKDLTQKARRVVLHGAGKERFEDEARWNGERYKGSVRWMRRFSGVVPAIEKALENGRHKKRVERYLSVRRCNACEGSRLNAAARAVLLGGVPLAELGRTPIAQLGARLDGLELSPREARIARDLLSEVRRRNAFLCEVGLGYLTLDRSADSLSGGEAQRIRLAAQLGAGLSGVMYVLDEPSIGLHWRDHSRLLGALQSLRDLGNTVIVVEHDETTLRAADYLIDVGPGAGRHGGHIVAVGPPDELALADTPTGAMLRGEIALAAPETRRVGDGRVLRVLGASEFNLKDIDVTFPLGTLTVVAGVSGSGKSTLIERILTRAVERHLGREALEPGAHRKIEGLEAIDELVSIDASPIGRTPRSNPATYIGVFTHIRDLFASLPEARMRGYTKSRFSFNVAGGRCEACCGAGAKLVELQFLAPVTVPCEECGGHRFQAETLDVRYRGHSIADVLGLTAEEALELFKDHPKIARPLSLVVDVGLGYLTLGQPSTTISGGEAQRIKLVAHLKKRPKQHTLYLLDEPTTGLSLTDIARLVKGLQELVDMGHTVIVIEHNLDLIEAADHVLELGPDGGDAGGEVVVAGTPEDVEAVEDSPTGEALRAQRKARKPGRKRKAPAARRKARTETPAQTPTGGLEPDEIRVFGARTHNLAGIDVTIPRGALTVVTGPSGSGKSSLALDTIFTEGRRRFVESLSTYARQFLGTKDRPPVDRIEGLGPSVAVEARTASGHPRSTVATTTEIHDHLRVLWARAGTRRCPEHGVELQRTDASIVARRILRATAGGRGWVVAPVFGSGLGSSMGQAEEPDDPRAALAERLPAWRAAGFVRVLIDGKEARIDAVPGADGVSGGDARLPTIVHGQRLDLVIDRLAFKEDARARLADAIEQAETISHGRVSVLVKGGERFEYSTRGACPECGFAIEDELEPRHFSFNTHVGACDDCDGLGENVRCDIALLVQHPERSLLEGAVGGKLSRYLTKGKGYYENLLLTVGRSHRIDLGKPWEDLTDVQRELLAYGTGARDSYKVKIERETRHAEIEEQFTASWPGLCGHIDAWHKKTEDVEWASILEGVMTRRVCSSCEGERLKAQSRAVTLGRKRLPALLRMSIEEACAWAEKLAGSARIAASVGPVLNEVRSRLGLIQKVGLGYLTLDRHTRTLSGGEARRVCLSASLGSQLVGVCYVLDEPTVGLHPRDVDRLTSALLELRDRGNTVIVVEHDTELMKRADWIVDMGPGAGRHGGRVVASGAPADVERHPESLTAAALRGDLKLSRTSDEPEEDGHAGTSRRLGDEVTLVGARGNNLRGVDFPFRFGQLTGVCGPSGSGKSTLVLDTLVPALRGEPRGGRWRSLRGLPGGGMRTVVVDASPIGRTPASIPATYTGLMDPLRELFARTPDARVRGFTVARFSFNGTQGRCPACDGRGALKVEMQFLADLWLVCEECDGKRYAPEVLEVRYRGHSIADVLGLTIEEALELLQHQPKIADVLKTLQDVGLGYMQLGQSSTTLSGGEAQRVKLASELTRAETGARGVVVLDEPSTGLAASDLTHLARVLDRLARKGNAVIVIEHHTGLLSVCDRLVELGPGGGDDGGRCIAVGTPSELAADPESITGPWLELEQRSGQASGQSPKQGKGRSRRKRARKEVTK